jgi:hypothetical protein
MPWIERLWDTPNVAHDNSNDQRFHASLILGFADTNALRAFFGSAAIATLSGKLPVCASAVHAYEVTDALTHVKDEQSPPALVRAPARTNFVAFKRCGREPAPTRRLDCPVGGAHVSPERITKGVWNAGLDLDHRDRPRGAALARVLRAGALRQVASKQGGFSVHGSARFCHGQDAANAIVRAPDAPQIIASGVF